MFWSVKRQKNYLLVTKCRYTLQNSSVSFLFQLQKKVIFEIRWVEITVHPQIVDGVKMYQVLPVSSHIAETGSTTKKHNLQIFMKLIWSL